MRVTSAIYSITKPRSSAVRTACDLEGIYAKLGVRSRSQAVRTALERGLVML